MIAAKTKVTREEETIKKKIYPETIIISKEENVDVLPNVKTDPELMDLDNRSSEKSSKNFRGKTEKVFGGQT